MLNVLEYLSGTPRTTKRPSYVAALVAATPRIAMMPVWTPKICKTIAFWEGSFCRIRAIVVPAYAAHVCSMQNPNTNGETCQPRLENKHGSLAYADDHSIAAM